MTTKFTLRNTFETDADTYWSRVFFEEEYNRRLYLDALGFKGFDLLELTGQHPGVRTRRIRVEPKTDAPAVVSKLIGGDITYVEDGRFEPEKQIWTFTTTPSKLADKIHIRGRLWVEPRGDKRVERFCETEIEVKVFGVGGVVEGFIEKTTRDSYAKTEIFTNAFIREKSL